MYSKIDLVIKSIFFGVLMQFDPQACRNLIAMIFLISIRDMRQDKIKRDKHEAKLFLESDYAEYLASFIDLDINEIRKRV